MVKVVPISEEEAESLFEKAEEEVEAAAAAAVSETTETPEIIDLTESNASATPAAEAAAEDDDDYSDTDSEVSDKESKTELATTRKPTVEDVDEDDEDDEEEEDDDDDDYEEDVLNETLTERIVALKAVVPPAYRNIISSVSSFVSSATSTTFSFTGKALWVITTSSLLLGVPLTLSVISEQQLIEMEKEMKLTQSTNELLAPGAESGFQQPIAA